MLEFIGGARSRCAPSSPRAESTTNCARRSTTALARCQKAAAEGRRGRIRLANTFFHEAIYAGSRNAYLAEQIRHARRQLQRYRVQGLPEQERRSRSRCRTTAHRRAIQAGDEDAAAKTMLLHVPAGTTGFSEFLATRADDFFETEAGPTA